MKSLRDGFPLRGDALYHGSCFYIFGAIGNFSRKAQDKLRRVKRGHRDNMDVNAALNT